MITPSIHPFKSLSKSSAPQSGSQLSDYLTCTHLSSWLIRVGSHPQSLQAQFDLLDKQTQNN